MLASLFTKSNGAEEECAFVHLRPPCKKMDKTDVLRKNEAIKIAPEGLFPKRSLTPGAEMMAALAVPARPPCSWALPEHRGEGKEVGEAPQKDPRTPSALTHHSSPEEPPAGGGALPCSGNPQATLEVRVSKPQAAGEESEVRGHASR